MAHKRNLRNSTRFDLKNQKQHHWKCCGTEDLKDLYWAGYFVFVSENLNTINSVSEQTFDVGFTLITCAN